LKNSTPNIIPELKNIDLGNNCILEAIDMKADNDKLAVNLSIDYPPKTDIIVLCKADSGETYVKSPFGSNLQFNFKNIPSNLSLRIGFSNETEEGMLKEIIISNPEQPSITMHEADVNTDYLQSIPTEDILGFVESILCLDGDQNLSIKRLLEYSIGEIGSYGNARHYAFGINEKINFPDPGLKVLNTVTSYICSTLVPAELGGSRRGSYLSQEQYNALKDYAKESIVDGEGNVDEYRIALDFVNDVLKASFKQLFIASPEDLQKAFLHYSQYLKPHLNIERNFPFGEFDKSIVSGYSRLSSRAKLINTTIDSYFNNDLDLEFGPITLIKTYAKDFHLAYLKEENFSIGFFHDSFEYYLGKFVNRNLEGKTQSINIDVLDEINLALSQMDVTIADGKYRALLAVKSIIQGGLYEVLNSSNLRATKSNVKGEL
jgi:hypothetical protein